MPSRVTVFASILVLSITVSAQSNPDLKNLLVYGEGFAFGVKEPAGWHGDTSEIATRYGVNVVFQSPSEPPESDVTIRVRVNKKVDENTIEDLNYDMDGYKREFPGVQFGDLNVAHAEYKTFAKVFFVQNRFYEYVAYLNPGTGKRFVVSVAMSKKGAPANENELEAYETVVRSIAWLSR